MLIETTSIVQVLFSILLFPTFFQGSFIDFAWGAEDDLWIMIAKRVFLLLPVAAVIAASWLTIPSVITVVFRGKRKSFVLALPYLVGSRQGDRLFLGRRVQVPGELPLGTPRDGQDDLLRDLVDHPGAGPASLPSDPQCRTKCGELIGPLDRCVLDDLLVHDRGTDFYLPTAAIVVLIDWPITAVSRDGHTHAENEQNEKGNPD